MVISPRTFSSGHVVCGAYVCVCLSRVHVCSRNVQPDTVCACVGTKLLLLLWPCVRATVVLHGNRLYSTEH